MLACTRTGGDLITITGTSFGPSGAFALVGPSVCKVNKTDDATDTRIVCSLPKGKLLAQSLLVFQASSQYSNSPVAISYTQCSSGYEDDAALENVDCKPCHVGTFKGTVGSSPCILCPNTQYANSSGMSTCFNCPSNGAANEQRTSCSCNVNYVGIGGNGANGSCVACPEGLNILMYIFYFRWKLLICRNNIK